MPRPALLASGAALGLGLAGAWCWPAPAPLLPAIAPRLGIPCRLPASPGVAITFDDGPHPEGTPAVLEALAVAGAIATFYLVGEQVERWPGLAARIAAEGHEIALHGQIHRLLLRRPVHTLRTDLLRALDVIGEATGRAPTSYRAPYGVFSAGALSLARELGLEPLLWSRWGRDWGPRETPELIARRASRNLGPGDVVLLHDADHYSAPGSWRRTAAALPSVLASVATSGLTFVSVSQDV
jgi:peptidoglycan/xylan/chitin deacetylase (PgdA/CDA1 family)